MKKHLICAGHDFQRTGVSGITSKGELIREERYATWMRDAIRSRLEARGIPVATDGEPGENERLSDAIKRARRPDITGIAVDIHLNGANDPRATGVEVLADEDDRAIAQSLAAVVAGVTGFRLRGDRGYKPKDSGHHARLGFIERGGGMVLELGFVTNRADADILHQRSAQIADALANWFEARARSVPVKETPAPSAVAPSPVLREIADRAAEGRPEPVVPVVPPAPQIPASLPSSTQPPTPMRLPVSRRDAVLTGVVAGIVTLLNRGVAWVTAHPWQVATAVLAVLCVCLAAWVVSLSRANQVKLTHTLLGPSPTTPQTRVSRDPV